jgi:hypothetical protein
VAASFDPGIAMDALNAMPAVETLIPPMSFGYIEQLFKRDPQKMIDEYNKSQENRYDQITAKDVYSLAPASTEVPKSVARAERKAQQDADFPRDTTESPWANDGDLE